jgi:hypothetical protein
LIFPFDFSTPLIFPDLGGNVAEWAEKKDGKGELQGASADRPADAKQAMNRAGLEYQGFRVVKEK